MFEEIEDVTVGANGDKSHTLLLETMMKSGKLEEAQLSELRVTYADNIQQSLGMWNKMTPEHKTVISRIIQRSLEHMHASVDTWLPSAMLEGLGGDVLYITSAILLLDIKSQVDLTEDITEFESERMRRLLTQIVNDDGSNLEDDEEFLDWVAQTIRQKKTLSHIDSVRLLALARSASPVPVE